MNALEPINGKTSLLGIIADPVAQVAAPGLINTELLRRGQLGEFVLVPFWVEADGLAEVIAGLRRTRNFRGAVITMPHKQAVLPLLDERSAAVQEQGACNAIHRSDDGRLHGEILDGAGLVHSLQRGGHQISGQRVLLLGAGGAARSIAFAMARAGASAVGIRNRTPAHALQLATAVSAAQPLCKVSTVPHDLPLTGSWDIVINATPLGLRPTDRLPMAEDQLREGLLVVDIVISPLPTAFLRAAQSRGCRTHTGRQMLEAQKILLLNFMLGGNPT